MNTATITTKRKKRKSPAGISTNELVLTAYQGTNDDVFPHVLTLFVPPGSKVADVTFGNGVFWRNVPPGQYELLATDLIKGIDCLALPYDSTSIDCIVFDPPYMHTPGGTAHVGHQNYEGYYQNNKAGNETGKKYHEAVLELYFEGAAKLPEFCGPKAYTSSNARTRFVPIVSD